MPAQRARCPFSLADAGRLAFKFPHNESAAPRPMDFLIYLFCLCVGVFFTLLSAIFGHAFGGDHGHVEGSGGHAEAGADASDAPGISALSPTVISCFAAAFG